MNIIYYYYYYQFLINKSSHAALENENAKQREKKELRVGDISEAIR